jgi:hypothetical protein
VPEPSRKGKLFFWKFCNYFRLSWFSAEFYPFSFMAIGEIRSGLGANSSPPKESDMNRLLGQVNSQGYAPGETPDSFKRVHKDTLEFVAQNATSASRRQLAKDELARRAAL